MVDLKYPKISIITPSYNQVEFLGKAIESVLNQNYPNLEYIIIDGGSTDGSKELIESYSTRLTYWESAKDKGQYYAINKGFEKSTGDIMAWLNSDDMYFKGALNTIAEIFTSFDDVNWVMGVPTVFDEQDRAIVADRNRKRRCSRFHYLASNDYEWIQQESTFWRRSLWDKSGGNINTNYKLAADFELWMRFYEHSKLDILDSLIGGFRMRKSDQKTLESSNDYFDEAKIIIENQLKNLSRVEKIEVERIKQLQSKMSNKLFNKLFKSSQKYNELVFQCTNWRIKFDRLSQRFYI
jgi:glycosyltransferase involved in cell wall biosynthesis